MYRQCSYTQLPTVPGVSSIANSLMLSVDVDGSSEHQEQNVIMDKLRYVHKVDQGHGTLEYATSESLGHGRLRYVHMRRLEEGGSAPSDKGSNNCDNRQRPGTWPRAAKACH